MRNETEDLKNELSLKEEQISKAHKKQFDLSEEITLLNNKLSSQNMTIQKLSQDLKKIENPINLTKKLLNNQNPNYFAQKNDEIDINLMLFLQENPLPIKITRISEGKYMYGATKVEISLENFKLFVNCGNNEKKTLEEFNKSQLFREINEILSQFYGKNEENVGKTPSDSQIIEIKEEKKMQIKKENIKMTPQKNSSQIKSVNKSKDLSLDSSKTRKKN